MKTIISMVMMIIITQGIYASNAQLNDRYGDRTAGIVAGSILQCIGNIIVAESMPPRPVVVVEPCPPCPIVIGHRPPHHVVMPPCPPHHPRPHHIAPQPRPRHHGGGIAPGRVHNGGYHLEPVERHGNRHPAPSHGRR